MKTFFIADTHFGDKNIMMYEGRPFDSTKMMDAAMITRWNAVVGDDDTVYHLGDLGGFGRESELISQLKGRKYLIKGNHDTQSNEFYRKLGFAEVYDKPVILNGFWILSHKPLYINDRTPYANIFGHVHSCPVVRDFSSHHYCVSVERINYTPVDFITVKTIMREAVT